MNRPVVATYHLLILVDNSMYPESMARPLWSLLLVAMVLVLSVTPGFAQAGRLDPTFGQGGKVVTNIPGPMTAIARAVALQSDGKIVVAGGLGAGQEIGLVRYNTNGALDGSFGRSGIAIANIPNNILSSASGVAIEVDGKILSLHDRLIVRDMAGNEVVNVHRRLLTLTPTYEITRGADTLATFRKHFFSPFVDRFTVDIPGPDDLEMSGSLFEHE